MPRCKVCQNPGKIRLKRASDGRRLFFTMDLKLNTLSTGIVKIWQSLFVILGQCHYNSLKISSKCSLLSNQRSVHHLIMVSHLHMSITGTFEQFSKNSKKHKLQKWTDRRIDNLRMGIRMKDHHIKCSLSNKHFCQTIKISFAQFK